MAAGNKGRQGGAQPGAGRKKKVDEEWARKVCMKAVIDKYGSIEAGIEIILSLGDERLKLFVWQHILGVPETITKVKHSDNKGGKLEGGILGGGQITIEVVRTIHNKDVDVNGIEKDNNTAG